MKQIQYTIRNIPKELDEYLRKLADIRDESLNRVVIDELSEKIRHTEARTELQKLSDKLDWFICNTYDAELDENLKKFKQEDRAYARRELEKETVVGNDYDY